MNPVSLVLIGLIRGYRLMISPILPASCRFAPSCSAYGIEAIEQRGPVAGSWLALRRILRCHPWGGSGYDPLPDRPASPSRQASPSRASGLARSGHSHP